MDKPKKDKIFINKNAGDVTKGVEMFNKSMTFNTQSSTQEELNQRIANNDISSEEAYNILNQISDLRDEAEKEDDHNNPRGAIELHKEADKLQETKTKKTTIRECLNKMDLQASDDGFRGITLVDLYEACTLTKDDKNCLIKMLQTTDDAEKVREFLSNKCEFEDAPEDDIDSEVQLECTKSDWEKLNDLDEGYQQGDEQVLDPDSKEYKKFEKIVDLLNEANIIYTSGRRKGDRAYFYIDNPYLDFSLDWKWTTIVREDGVQVLSPADWLSIINEESTPEEIVNKIVTKDYSGVQFANESQLEEASYGGAYDIEDDQYFTREELNEFGEEVADTLTDLGNGKVDLLSIYIDNGVLEITVDWEGNETTAEHRIDMRKIRSPKDLNKFVGTIIDKMSTELKDLGFNFHPNKEDLDESKPMNEAREYYILPVENLIGSERRELGYYDLEMIGRKGLITYIEGTYPDLSDYTRNVLDFDLEEDDPMLTLSSEWDEELDEDVIKQGNKWVNKGKEGTHGTFKTKKDALKQTRAMYARGYKK